MNFSLRVSSLTLGKGLNPSITGGWEKSKGIVPVGDIFGVWSATAGVVAAAMFALDTLYWGSSPNTYYISHKDMLVVAEC